MDETQVTHVFVDFHDGCGPQRRPVVMPPVADAVDRLRGKRPEPDWENFRACPVCKVKLGDPCVIMSGRGPGGEVQPVKHYRTHMGRRRRTVGKA